MKKNLHVLLVEDSDDDALLVLSVLGNHYQTTHERVQTASDMRKALSSKKWDLILCDYCMPAFDAPGALQVLQSTGKHIPFIIVSGTVGEETAVEALKLGADDYLLKQKLTRLVPAIERSLHEVEIRRQQELAERKIQEQSKLLDKARDAIILIDLNGRILYWNKGAELLYGWSSAEALDQNAGDLLLNEDREKTLNKAIATVLETGDWSGEFSDRTKDKTTITVQSSWTLLRDGKGTPESILVINTDITEKKNLQAQIMHAQRLESIGTLTSGITHDFNNFLTMINCTAEARLMELPSGDSPERETLESIHDAGRRATNLTTQLLAFSRKSAMQARVLSLNEIISGLEHLLKRIVGYETRLVLELDSRPGYLYSDPVHLEQIILNLAINARDAISSNGILRIGTGRRWLKANELSTNPEAQPGSYLVLAVSDNGSGMTEEIKARIFEPFFTTKGEGKGTGLGLSTVYGIVKQNHGIINLESRPGQGTTFEILLPETTAEGTEVPIQQQKTPERTKTIVLADDNSTFREITQLVLETQGFTVLDASQGKEALAHIEKNPQGIDIVLSDITMPGMNSSDFIEAVEKLSPGLPILFMSGSAHHAFLERYLTRTGLPFLLKPFTTQSLKNKLNEVLEKTGKNV